MSEDRPFHPDAPVGEEAAGTNTPYKGSPDIGTPDSQLTPKQLRQSMDMKSPARWFHPEGKPGSTDKQSERSSPKQESSTPIKDRRIGGILRNLLKRNKG